VDFQEPAGGWPLRLAIFKLVREQWRENARMAWHLESNPRLTEESHATNRRIFWMEICERLQLGELVARGFQHGKSKDEPIPAAFFYAATPDYKADTVHSHGLTFYVVRIRVASDVSLEPVVAMAEGKRKRADYRDADYRLVVEMKRLVDNGDATGPMNAARAVVKKAVGNGSEDSKVKRLILRYEEVSGQSGQN